MFTGPWATACWTAAGALVGTLLGYRLALAKDRRNERNAVADRLRITLLKRGGFDPIDADLYLQVLPFWQRWRFRRAVQRYEKATADYQQEPTYGTRVYTASAAAEIKASIDALLRLTRWR